MNVQLQMNITHCLKILHTPRAPLEGGFLRDYALISLIIPPLKGVGGCFDYSANLHDIKNYSADFNNLALIPLAPLPEGEGNQK